MHRKATGVIAAFALGAGSAFALAACGDEDGETTVTENQVITEAPPPTTATVPTTATTPTTQTQTTDTTTTDTTGGTPAY